MRTVFLVDDDLIMLQHIRELINWQSMGYDVIGQAMDGPSAIEQILRLKPFLVLLDVELPGANGVEVLRRIHAQSPATHVIMLSNYDTFSYVRPALKLGAADYLLKQEVTSELLHKKLADLDDGPAEEHPLTALRSRQQQLLACLTGKDGAPFSAQGLGRGQLILFEIDQFDLLGLFPAYQDLSKLIASVESTTHTLLATVANGVAVHLSYGMFAVFILAPEGADAQKLTETTRHVILMLRNNLKRILQISITVAAGTSPAAPGRLSAVYHYLLDTNFPPPLPLPSLEMEQQLATALRFGDREKLMALLAQCFRPWQGAQVRQAVPAATALMRICQRFCSDQGLCPSAEAENRLLTCLRTCMTTDQLIEQVTGRFKLVSQLWTGSAMQGASAHVLRAIEYIHQNYAQDISLATAAQALHISGEHLSRLFKKETGVSFSQYVNHHRIQLAQRLMKEEHLRAADVYELVGFRSLNYFMRAYKKSVGQTIGQSLAEDQ